MFYSLHHLFLTRYGVYAVLFNMQWMVNRDEKKRSETLSFIEFWLNSIYLHTYTEEERGCAPILLIGTHKDIVTDAAQHELISKLLVSHFSERMASTAWPKVQFFSDEKLCFFPVNNKLGHTDPAIFASLKVGIIACVYSYLIIWTSYFLS